MDDVDEEAAGAAREQAHGEALQYPHPPHPPYGGYRPPPPRSGISTLVIVIAGALVLGGGACVLIGALVVVGAAADDGQADANGVAQTSPTNVPPTATARATGDDEPPAPTPTAATADPPTQATNNGGDNVTPVWFCNATGFVRVCGFANVCNNINVFGSGSGTDRYLASNTAKMACEGQARARGGFTTCAVSCSVATKR